MKSKLIYINHIFCHCSDIGIRDLRPSKILFEHPIPVPVRLPSPVQYSVQSNASKGLMTLAINRLQSISSQLQHNNSPPRPTMATPSRDPITCHVLDTTTGRPAADMQVKLVCCTIPDIIFEC